MYIVSSLPGGGFDQQARDTVRRYVLAQQANLRLATKTLVFANILDAANHQLVTSIRDPYLLPSSAADERRRILEQFREMHDHLLDNRDLAQLPSDPILDNFARRLLRFLIEADAKTQSLFPDLCDLARGDGEFLESADEDTLRHVREQLGGDDVEVRWDGLEALYHELLETAIGELHFRSLDAWLQAEGVGENECRQTLGTWFHYQAGSVDYRAARRQLRALSEGGGVALYP